MFLESLESVSRPIVYKQHMCRSVITVYVKEFLDYSCVLWQISEKQFILTALGARAKLKSWFDVDSLFNAKNWLGYTKKRSPIGFHRVVDILQKNSAPVNVRRFPCCNKPAQFPLPIPACTSLGFPMICRCCRSMWTSSTTQNSSSAWLWNINAMTSSSMWVPSRITMPVFLSVNQCLCFVHSDIQRPEGPAGACSVQREAGTRLARIQEDPRTPQ